MALDHLSPSVLFEKDVHKRTHYPYIFYCDSCHRSYLAREKEEVCKFCHGPIRPVTGTRKYIFYCPRCDARTESDTLRMACETCGDKLMSLYRWDMLEPIEQRRITLARFFKRFSEMMPEIQIKKKTSSIKKSTSTTSSPMPEPPSLPRPSSPASIAHPKRLPSRRYPGEEMPSDSK